MRQRSLRLFERRGLLTHDEVEAMFGWSHGGGFSIDASVRIAADDRRGLERLLRYCARPLIFASRTSDPGQTPLEFLSLDRAMANELPRSRLHRTTTASRSY